jgi:hypothetical protein
MVVTQMWVFAKHFLTDELKSPIISGRKKASSINYKIRVKIGYW